MTIGKKTIRLIEASASQALYRLGHKASDMRTMSMRSYYLGPTDRTIGKSSTLEYGTFFTCPRCINLKDKYTIISSLDFQLVKVVESEYFHLFAQQRTEKDFKQKITIAIFDMDGNDALIKRDIPKTHWCTKYQNMA